LLQSAGSEASQTLFPATAKQSACMAETARPANSLVWTPHRAERFGKRLIEAAFKQVSRHGEASAEAGLPEPCSRRGGTLPF